MTTTSGFSATSTTDEVLAGLDLTGRRFLVTGASGGLGLETSRALASKGAIVVMAARDQAKNETAAAGIRAVHPDAKLESLILDLGSLTSVRAAAVEFMSRNVALHGLILNAGIMATPLGHTVDGFEQQFGVDHLGHFLLARDLLPRLVESAPARVVVLSSAGHQMGDVDFDDVNFERRDYEPFLAYGAAKTCNVLHAVEIDRRYRDQGVRAFAVHPGVIHTELGRYMTDETMASLISRLSESPVAMAWKSAEQGAATSVWAATSPLLDGRGGEYCEDCNVSAVVTDGELNEGGVAARAVDPARASTLWALSEELVG
ncbi:MAG: SDR family NAD(P)-dependent oxidoreductase [Ilumatobacteraceae bacterium]|mgnify:FL=1|jgi:NAD(P)-dependent dehydrogenase (short-subunit alcohol dehydrogenase family)|nr:SDR family NAD(P)-dependent oxidoreductase [Ilumatobacteraceae bacterium]MDP4705260.1 SDR family NAD(P)-dependent oxidoreductase [Ilumatobacteraceae bacterium]MDP4713777.1 SDR family NAD(P)-dependent oxidoreductase [Ilumatobacteraceae bacterium]MDP4935776.1 SDR family NAD(P)-dependent oxidoreductase [Ilumatobacteraceae bacterium]MDP4977773.1 SDR family NAD(P)-dependent oxidoreductase [Ilumatobacteraceae bacterium]